MTTFEQIIRSAINDESESSKTADLLAEKVLAEIDRKRRFYVFVKLVIYSFSTLLFLVGLIFIWQSEKINIVNSEVVNLFSLLFSDSAVVAKYWQEYVLSLLESFPAVSVIAVGIFVWAVSASLWMTVKTYLLFINRFAKRLQI